MTFLLDENFPKSVTPILEGEGHQVIDFREKGEEGACDREVVEFALAHRAVILTADRDFFHTLSAQYPNHNGIVVIALKHPTRIKIIQRLQWLLSNVSEADFPRRAFQLKTQAWMAYPPIV